MILECYQEEQAVGQDAPNGYIRNHPSDEAMRIDHGGSVPQYRNKRECERPRDDSKVPKVRNMQVAEVQGRQVEKVQDKRDLSNPEPAVYP